jgi:hypothetical protein
MALKENNEVAILSRPARHFFSVFAALAAAVFAGCSGSSQLTPMGTQQGPASAVHAPLVNPASCKHYGKVLIDVDPCSVTFTASKPGPDKVTASAPKLKSHPLEKSDNCGGASGVATLTRRSGTKWTVTAGPKTGSCTAIFIYVSDSHVNGTADLSITNSI